MIGLLIDMETGDLQVKNGGLVIGESMSQVAEFILIANPGDFKEYPLIGAELFKLNNGSADLLWCSKTKNMLSACGVNVSRVTVSDNQITIE